MITRNGNGNRYDLTKTVKINGRDNFVDAGCDNVLIVGDGNSVLAGVRNVTLINTDGVTVTESNCEFVNNQKIINGVAQPTNFDLIKGGDDEIANPFQSPVIAQLITGGLDEVRGLNNINEIHTIDGNG